MKIFFNRRTKHFFISDILETMNSLQIDGLLITIDIEKSFDYVNPFFS